MTFYAQQHSPYHLLPACPLLLSKLLSLLAAASSDHFHTIGYLPQHHHLSPVLQFLSLWREGEDHCGRRENRNLGGDKVPLRKIRGATCGKVYLRDEFVSV